MSKYASNGLEDYKDNLIIQLHRALSTNLTNRKRHEKYNHSIRWGSLGDHDPTK